MSSPASLQHAAFERDQPATMPSSRAPRSPPLAFQSTSNDDLSFAPGYFASLSDKPQYEVSSPVEQDLEAQVMKQSAALRLQHQAFVVERECWELERERLHKRIAALEGLLKSPKGPSPARSPVIPPHPNGGAVVAPPPRLFSAGLSIHLPSIAESFSPIAEERRVAFPRVNGDMAHVIQSPSKIMAPKASRNGHLRIDSLDYDGDALSPTVSNQILSPPPLDYRKNAGHTPIRILSRPGSSQGLIDKTPTRLNTQRNTSANRAPENDTPLSGPLRLPALPSEPDAENFTVEALTLRLQYIEQHPDENEPLALSARSNRDSQASELERVLSSAANPKPSAAEIDEVLAKDSPPFSQGNASGVEMSSPPASVVSQALSPQEFHDKGITLKKKTSTNFGAPFGQLKP